MLWCVVLIEGIDKLYKRTAVVVVWIACGQTCRIDQDRRGKDEQMGRGGVGNAFIAHTHAIIGLFVGVGVVVVGRSEVLMCGVLLTHVMLFQNGMRSSWLLGLSGLSRRHCWRFCTTEYVCVYKDLNVVCVRWWTCSACKGVM